MNSLSARCTWDFDLTVPVNTIVVASGELVEQVLSPSQTTKLCSFRMDVPVSSACVGLAAGPFEVIQDVDNEKLFYFCPPGYIDGMDNSVALTPKALESMEDYLTPTPPSHPLPAFPFKSYKQVPFPSILPHLTSVSLTLSPSSLHSVSIRFLFL